MVTSPWSWFNQVLLRLPFFRADPVVCFLFCLSKRRIFAAPTSTPVIGRPSESPLPTIGGKKQFSWQIVPRLESSVPSTKWYVCSPTSAIPTGLRATCKACSTSEEAKCALTGKRSHSFAGLIDWQIPNVRGIVKLPLPFDIYEVWIVLSNTGQAAFAWIDDVTLRFRSPSPLPICCHDQKTFSEFKKKRCRDLYSST